MTKPKGRTDEIKRIRDMYSGLGETKRIILWCILIGLLVYVVAFQLGINQGIAVSNQPPMETYTISGMINLVMTAQLPFIYWLGIFLFLWLTKW